MTETTTSGARPAEPGAAAEDATIRPFQVSVSEEELVDLGRRLALARWPSKELVADGSQGRLRMAAHSRDETASAFASWSAGPAGSPTWPHGAGPPFGHRLPVLDIGSGGLQIAAGEGDRPELAESLPLGATRLTRRFVYSDPCVPTNGSPSGSTPHAFGFAGIDGQTAPVLPREALDAVAGHLAATTARQRRRLAALLRLADGLDADHFQVVDSVRAVDRGDHVRLELRARGVPDLDMWAAERNGDLFELEVGRRVEPVAVEVA